MHDYSNTRLSDDFINLTDRAIHLYEESNGEIRLFQPSSKQLPKVPVINPDKPVTHYIIDERYLARLNELGRPLDDIAVILLELTGRQGIVISYLYWGKDPEINVKLYEGGYKTSFPHL